MPKFIPCLALSLLTIQAAYGSPLVGNSPFVPSDFVPPAEPAPLLRTGPTPTRTLEFRGVYELEGKLHFHLFDSRENKGEWVGLNDPLSRYRVASFSLDENALTLELDGQPLELKLSSTRTAPSPPAPAVASQAPPDVTLPPERATSSRRRAITPPPRQASEGPMSEAPPEVRRAPRRVRVPTR